MTATGDLLSLSRATQALALVGEGVKTAGKKTIKAKDFVGLGLKNIVGTSFIRTQAQLSSGL